MTNRRNPGVAIVLGRLGGVVAAMSGWHTKMLDSGGDEAADAEEVVEWDSLDAADTRDATASGGTIPTRDESTVPELPTLNFAAADTATIDGTGMGKVIYGMCIVYVASGDGGGETLLTRDHLSITV